MYILNNKGPNMKPCGTPLKYLQNYYKNHSPLFFASFSQGKMLKSIANLYLHHTHLVLQLTIGDRYNQKPWRGL